jgi:transposase
MLNMSEIDHIREMKKEGRTISDINRETGVDRKTIRKYIALNDFSPKPAVTQERSSILDPYKEKIKEWLASDKSHWRKQRHTAKKICDRLHKECGYEGSYNTVQRYVKEIREQTKTKASLELVWQPGVAQVDFGEADFIENGNTVREKYLVVSFPYSNDGYAQVFGGETAECVCQGLKDIFEYIGGVPPLLIFDNATGVGHRVHNNPKVRIIYFLLHQRRSVLNQKK